MAYQQALEDIKPSSILRGVEPSIEDREKAIQDNCVVFLRALESSRDDRLSEVNEEKLLEYLKMVSVNRYERYKETGY